MGSLARQVEQIARGVAAIHRAGILHLDLKPPNILLDSEPGSAWESIALKVADFGIARMTSPGSRTTGLMRGKVAYMAPGHCTGEPAFAAFRKAFGDQYLYAGLGSVIELP